MSECRHPIFTNFFGFVRLSGLAGLLLAGCCIILLSCKESPPDSTATLSAKHLELTLSSPLQVDSDSFPNSDEITIKVRLLDASNNPVKAEIITLSSTLGSLSASQILTDGEGYATAKMSSTDTLGAGTVTAMFDTVSSKYNFELLAALPPLPLARANIMLSLLRSGVAINRFKSNESVQLQAKVTDANNAPMANQVVLFAPELGTTNVPSGLTDLNGIAQVNLTSSETNLGAAVAVATATINTVKITAQVNYEIISSAINITEQVIKLGSFNSSNQFVENILGSSIAADSNGAINISAGATLGISLALVDENNQRIMAPTQVNFTSSCTASLKAKLGTGVFTVNGVANTTYEDVSCGGGQDVISASVTVNNQATLLTQVINTAPENIGSIAFVSLTPESIVLKGTGGQGQQETATLTFLVKGALGNPLAQQTVTFSLNTSVGNLTLTPATSITNSLGLVTTKVNAGNVPTAVRVTAAVTATNNQIIQTQSDLLSVNTGLPDQDSFSLSLETFNPETENYDGIEVALTARLADAFNNPVPDGTTVNFTTEGGSVIPSCNTTNGACSIKWTSGEPRVADHRITLLATAIGHETFNDTNGNNTFDVADGAGFMHAAESGFGRVAAQANGFFDMSEAWRDDNENYIYDIGEKFIDFDNNQIFGANDGLFNGPQCTGSLCGLGAKQSVHVRKAIELTMSGSEARMTLMSGQRPGTGNASVAHINGHYVYATNDSGNAIQTDGIGLSIAEDGSESFTLTFADRGLPFGQTLPAGTTIQITASAGSLEGVTSYTVPNTQGAPNVYNGQRIDFIVKNSNTAAATGDIPISGTLSMKATTLKGIITTVNFDYTLEGS